MLIGLNGLKGSGKDTAGAYLVERYGFERLSFALDLKRSAAAALGVPADDGEAFFEELKNNPDARIMLVVRERGTTRVLVDISVREYLQFYGTEAHRDIFGKDFWTRILIARLDGERNYVITDSRFENECGAVRDVGGSIIVIDRQAVAGTGDTHASEDALPEELVDTVLYNNGSIEDLHRTIDAYMTLAGAVEDGTSIESVGVDSIGISVGSDAT